MVTHTSCSKELFYYLQVRSGNASAHQKTWFYFYQSSDGQAAYLHPLNIQMLVRQYGALELCPHVIEGRIIENETLSMTEELRHRMRYLSHMPISSQFQSVELALDEPLVDVDVLQEFKGVFRRFFLVSLM